MVPRPELSIVIPFLNEENVLPLLQKRLQELRTHPDWELLFVSDGSTDSSVRILTAWAAQDPSVKVVELTRNFGHQAAVSAGLSLASGRYAGVMDADLQDEPEILLQMHEEAVAGNYDVIYAVRTRRGESAVKRFCYYVFYRLFSFFADSPVQIDSGDFCVMNRRALDLLLDLPERSRFVRGLRAWLGMRSKAFQVVRAPRSTGRAAILALQVNPARQRRDYFIFHQAFETRICLWGSLVFHRFDFRGWICRDCGFHRHPSAGAGLYDSGRASALLQWIDFSLYWDSR